MTRIWAHGCFDCLHVGHLYHLAAARRLGDELVVALTADRYVNKGLGRPVFSWKERHDMLTALRIVDAVYLVYNYEQVVSLMSAGDIYVKGMDWAGHLPEQEMLERKGCRVEFIDAKPSYSSTSILTGKLLNERIAADRARS